MFHNNPLALHPHLKESPYSLSVLPRTAFCLFKANGCHRSPGGAALFAHTVVLGGRITVAHHAARPPLFPPVHHPLCLRARVTLKYEETRIQRVNRVNCAVEFATRATSATLSNQHSRNMLS